MMRSNAGGIAVLTLVVLRATCAWPAETDPSVLKAERDRVATIAKLSPAVVAVFQRRGAGGGSGVLISRDGYALTNFHVVGEDSFFKCGLSNGKLYDAVLVGVDPTGDVALIKLVGRDDFPTATLGNSDSVRVGDWVYVLGNPFLLAADFRPTVTYGIVSGVHRYQYPADTILEYTDCLQVDASVNPGNSGGPLFDAAGALIGINGRISIAQRGRVNAGAGYAISINQIRNFLGNLRSGRIVDHATLGATVSTDSHGAVVVSQILDQSDAYRRGLRTDDGIVSFAGRPIRSVNQFKNVLGIFPEAWKIPLVYEREGQKHEIRVRLRPLHAKVELESEMPRERPEESPRGRRPDDRRKDRPPAPPRRPRLRAVDAHAEPQLSDQVKQLFIQKPGFANYYFNQLEQKRTLRGLDAMGVYPRGMAWSFSGTTATGVPFECVLTDSFSSLEMGGKAFLQQADQEPQDEPPGTGGLLIGLNQLRLLMTQRDKPFTSFAYLGTEPIDGGAETVDVLLSTLGSVETKWYFSAATGVPLGFDTRLLEDTDDCQVRFREIGVFDGKRFPSEIVVRHSDAEFATFRVLRVKERK